MCKYLEDNNVKCWIAPRDIPVGADYGDLIEKAIKASKVVVLVFSKYASTSKWVKGEVNVAFTENKPILPFRVDETEVSGSFRVMLNQMHWINAFPNYSNSLPNLFESLKDLVGIQTSSSTLTTKSKSLAVRWGIICATVAVITLLLYFLVLRKPAPEMAQTQNANTTSGSVTASSSFEVKNVNKDLVITNGQISYVLKSVDGGSFKMGCSENEAYLDEGPVHIVKIEDFRMGETEVTQAFWLSVMGSEPTYNGGWQEEHGEGPDYPAYRVSWNDCKAFLNRLNQITGKTFRLPSEAEWEYAAKGGNYGLDNNYIYAGSNTIENVAWYDDNSDNMTHPVKGKQANSLMLYDMSGNVWEWCEDYYGAYNRENNSDYSSYRVLRGGSWHMSARYCRVTKRESRDPSSGGVNYGFRIAL